MINRVISSNYQAQTRFGKLSPQYKAKWEQLQQTGADKFVREDRPGNPDVSSERVVKIAGVYKEIDGEIKRYNRLAAQTAGDSTRRNMYTFAAQYWTDYRSRDLHRGFASQTQKASNEQLDDALKALDELDFEVNDMLPHALLMERYPELQSSR